MPTPAPMPMVGMVSCSEMSLAILGRHRLELQHEAAGVLDGERVLQDLHGGVCRAALDLEAAEHGDGVRGQADVRGGGDAGVHKCFQDVRLRFAALRLDRIRAGLLHEARGIGERPVDRVVTLVGHAPEHEGVGRAAADRLGVHHHHVHGRRDGRGMAMRDHSQAVADHGDIDAGHLRPLGARVVRHRHVDHLLAGLLDSRISAMVRFSRFFSATAASLPAWVMGPPSRRRLPPCI